jgi:hypothetical protein
MYWSKYDLVNIFSGKIRTITHKEAVKWIGKDELAECLENGWYGDSVIAPSLNAKEIKG